jgi:hypothetical protein
MVRKDSTACEEVMVGLMYAMQENLGSELKISYFSNPAFNASQGGFLVTMPEDLFTYATELLPIFKTMADSVRCVYTLRAEAFNANFQPNQSRSILWGSGNLSDGSVDTDASIAPALRIALARSGFLLERVKQRTGQAGVGLNSFHIDFQVLDKLGQIKTAKLGELRNILLPSGAYFHFYFSVAFTQRYKIKGCCGQAEAECHCARGPNTQLPAASRRIAEDEFVRRVSARQSHI